MQYELALPSLRPMALGALRIWQLFLVFRLKTAISAFDQTLIRFADDVGELTIARPKIKMRRRAFHRLGDCQ